MMEIPIQAVPSQSLNVVLAGQNCLVSIYQKSTGVFADLAVNGVTLLTAVLCYNCNRIVRRAYIGFVGDLAFIDTQGTDDPVSTGFGTRWRLLYLEAGDIIPGA